MFGFWIISRVFLKEIHTRVFLREIAGGNKDQNSETNGTILQSFDRKMMTKFVLNIRVLLAFILNINQ